MAWKESHKPESRQRILNSAAELFTRKGFNQVGIDEVMQAAGLTRGAFYAHFNSKVELYEEAISCAGLVAANHLRENTNSLDQIIDRYLSLWHLNSTDIRCPISCLVSEVAHNDERIKEVYTRMLKGFSGFLGKMTPQQQNEDTQLLQTILLVGGMAIARSLADDKLAKKILSISSHAAKQATQLT